MSKPDNKLDLQAFARDILGYDLTEQQLKVVKMITDAHEKGEQIMLGGGMRAGRTSAVRVANAIIKKYSK